MQIYGTKDSSRKTIGLKGREGNRRKPDSLSKEAEEYMILCFVRKKKDPEFDCL